MGTGNTPPTGTGLCPGGLPLATPGPLTLELSDLVGPVDVCPPVDSRYVLHSVDTAHVIGCTGLPTLR